jgi:hypothetical protein
MSDENQAEADTNDDTMVDDRAAHDTSNDPTNNGATDPVKAYEAEVADLLARGDQPDEDDSTDDDADSGNGEEDDANDDADAEESADDESGDESSEEEEIPSDEEEEPENSQQSRYRIRAKDEVENEALALRKRHPDWSLKDCLAKAEQVLGVGKADESEAAADDATPARTTELVTKEITDLRAQKKEALAAMEFEKVADLDDQIDALRDEKEDLRVKESHEANTKRDTESVRFNSEWEQSEARAVAHYPDCTKADSPLVKRMNEIDARMKRLDDPLFNSPDKPFLLAKQAAKELAIPMVDPAAATKPAAKKATSNSRRPVTPASGNARTTEPADTATKLEKQIGNVTSLDDYEATVASFRTGG